VESIYADLLRNYNNGLLTCSLFIDLAKAFDTVNHNILIKKLHQYYGLNGTALQQFTSCLTNCKQDTVVNGAKSNCRNIACGIPQGSTLGPLLFIMYINDLPFCSKLKQSSMQLIPICLFHTLVYLLCRVWLIMNY